MWIEKEIKKYEDNEEYILEGKILDITEQVIARVNELSWNKKILAKKMNTSQAWITKMLNGNNNFTLRTLIKLSIVLNFKLKVDFVPKTINFYQNESIQDYMTLVTVDKKVILLSESSESHTVISDDKFSKQAAIGGTA